MRNKYYIDFFPVLFANQGGARKLETSKAKKGNNKKTFQKGALIIQILLGRNFNHLAVEPDKPNEPELAWPSWRLNWCPRKIGNDPNRYI